MELYNDSDLELFKRNIGDVIKKLDDYVAENYAPTKKEKREVQKIILDYAKENKRKMYGGYGLHLAIKSKNISGSFYSDDELYSKDIDLYSPEPLKDLVELCDRLHKAGFKNVYGREALHKETYTLEVNKQPYCDFSYVPRNIYNRIPFLQIDGFIVAYPYFLEIDYLKMFIDPILTHYRWEKSFDRFYLLQKYYPIKLSKKKLPLTKKMPQEVYDALHSFCLDNKTIVTTGFEPYNIYVNESKIKNDYIKPIAIPYFEFVSIDYENDVKKIIELLKEKLKDKISIIENYPFFTFTGFSTNIMYDGKLIAKVYDNLHNLCFAYTTHKIGSKTTMIGTFHFNLRMCLINAIYARVNDDKDSEQMFYDMASHLIQMRKYYFDGTNKTFFSDTIFKDFTTDCAGVTKNDKIDKAEEFKMQKNHSVFKYDPDQGKKIILEDWKFANSSGNKINNPKNFKIKFTDQTNDIHVIDNKEETKEETKEESKE